MNIMEKNFRFHEISWHQNNYCDHKTKQNKTKMNGLSLNPCTLQIEVNVIVVVKFSSQVIFVLGCGNVC